MSEKKAKDEILEKLNQLEIAMNGLKSEFKAIPQPPAVPATPLKEEKHEEKKGHATLEELDNCPECHKLFKVDEFKAKERALALKAYAEKLKTAKNIVTCKGCGLHVSKEEEKCPNCGGTKAD